MRNRTSSRIDAVVGCRPSEPAEAAKDGSSLTNGVLCEIRKGAAVGSSYSKSMPFPRKGWISCAMDIAAS